MLLVLLAPGCRTGVPDLKPASQPEVFNPPPPNANYNSYPKQAFNNDDPAKRIGVTNDPSVMPAKGVGPIGAMPQQPASFGGPGLR
jgi:hypothetical protein